MSLATEMRSLAQDILGSAEGRARAIAEIKGETSHQLGTLHKGRKDLSRKLRGSLAQGFSQLKAGVGAMLQAFEQGQKAVRQDIADGRSEWRKLITATRSRRARPAPLRAAPSSRIAGLPDRAFQYLANRPDGAKMTELEQALGAPRLQMAKALKSLMETNKAKKQGLLYFPA